MYLESEFDEKNLIHIIRDFNENGFCLVKSDKNGVLTTLSITTTYEEPVVVIREDGMIDCNVYPLFYKKYPNLFVKFENNDERKKAVYIGKSRGNAVSHLFNLWTTCGCNRHHAKDPYSCKAFMRYLKEIGFSDADYLLIVPYSNK